MQSTTEQMLRAIWGLIGRQTFSTAQLAEIVLSRGATSKQLKAFNMCDGTKSQAEIAKSLKLDSGNFSRTLSRWIEAGVIMRLGEGRDAKLLHIYALAPQTKEKS